MDHTKRENAKGYIEIDVVLSDAAKRGDEFRDAWEAGFTGKPVPDDASESWREAHALGASC